MKLLVPFALLLLLTGCQFDLIPVAPAPTTGSARLDPTVPPGYRGLYVDGFRRILGDSTREDSLLNWCNVHNINAISLYDLNTIMDQGREAALARFIRKARVTYGIGQVAAVRGSSANFQQTAGYDAARSDSTERFTVYNLENEWWNNGPSCDFSCYTSHLQTLNATARQSGTVAEAYMGWFQNPSGQELKQANTLVRWLDRVLVHDYRTYPQFSYMQSRLSFIGRAAQSQNRVMDVIVIFSAEPEFMQSYFSVTGQNRTFADAYADIVNQFNAAKFTGKANIRLIGYQIFDYSYARQARPAHAPLLQ